jgi:Icc-related predicted phosphoesterase
VRILLVSDLHYTLPQFDWVERRAADIDLVVVAGDHVDISSAVPVDVQLTAIVRHLGRLRELAPLVVASGNHDLTGRDRNGEKAALWLDDLRALGIAVDGDSLVLDDTLVTVCPWWDGPIGREVVAAQLAADAARRPGVWIWVYHWPPMGSPTSWTGRGHYGDADLRSWIEELHPDGVLCGHVHDSPFKAAGSWVDLIGRTWVFNPGRQIGPTPTHVVIDLAARSASWSSLAGEEEQSLNEPVARGRLEAQ